MMADLSQKPETERMSARSSLATDSTADHVQDNSSGIQSVQCP